VASAALYSASLCRAAAAATATKSSTSPEATASSSLSCLQWKISSCSTHSAPHVRRAATAAPRATRSPRVPELQPEMQSTGIETHIHHQNVQASQKKIRQDTRYARCGGCAAAAAATRLRRLQKEVALCWVILRIQYCSYSTYTQYPFIRNGVRAPPVGFLKNSPISDSQRFLIFQV
jgi:hypothetical protein